MFDVEAARLHALLAEHGLPSPLLDLGSSTVKAAAAAVAAIDAAATVPAGTDLPVTGSGWPVGHALPCARTRPSGMFSTRSLR